MKHFLILAAAVVVGVALYNSLIQPNFPTIFK